MQDHLPPEEGYDRTQSGLFVPKPEVQPKPNHDARRQIMKQVKRYNRQQTRENARRLARLTVSDARDVKEKNA